MTTMEGPHTHLRHEDKFLRTINANLYYGKGYPQYLHSENKEESIPVFEAVKKYILQDRPHLKGTHPIYNRMLREGILKVPVLFTTQVIYANYASRFFYTFAKLCGNRIIEEVVTNPTDEVVKRAVMETIERYIVVEEDTTETFMKAVIISLMLPDDRFAQSKVRAKIFDGINYFLKLAIADYMLMRNNAKEIIKNWENLAYQTFESTLSYNHKFNRTLPAFQTIVDQQDNRKVMIGSVRFSTPDLGKLVRCFVREYHTTVRNLLPDGMLMVDELYGEFRKHAKDMFSCTDLGYSVFYGTDELNKLSYQQRRTYEEAVGDKWKDQKYMRSKFDQFTRLNLNLFVCILITCGSPFRVTELLTLTFANPTDLVRTMYYSNGHIQINLLYNKNTHSSMRYSNHTKMLPIEVSKIVIHYVSIIKYLEVAIVEEHGWAKSKSDMSVSDDWEDDDEFDETDGNDLEDEASLLASRALSKRDEIKTLLFMYKLGPRNGGQVFKYLELVSEKYIREKYTPRILRQALVYFTRTLLGEAKHQGVGILNRIDSIAGHRSETADLQYGVTHSNMYLPSAARNNIDIQISFAWHKILELEEEEVKEEPTPSNRQELKKLLSLVDVGKEEIEEVGRRLYGNFKFGSMGQVHTVYDAFHSVKDLMVISPTGSGKSNAYKMPILMEKKLRLPFVSFIICPFISLLEDVKVKLKELGELEVEIFDSDMGHEYYSNCDIIVLQLEKVLDAAGLVRYFESGSVFRGVRRLIMDEAHALIEHREFRGPSVSRVRDVFGESIPKLFLTATFPKAMERELCPMFGISDWRVHREETTRKNIEHVVVREHVDVKRALRTIYAKEIRPRRTKGIVFVYLREMAKDLGERLGWMVFHGHMVPEEKAKAYKEFANTESAMMVATSAFSHGVDVEGISHVITVGSVPGSVDFQQVVGRMWRKQGNRVGRSIILLEPGMRTGIIRGDICVNGVLAQELDGKSDQSCLSLGCVACSVCDSNKCIRKEELEDEGMEEANPSEEVEEEEEENQGEEEDEVLRRLRECNFNILVMYGLSRGTVGVAESLGCYLLGFFPTVIITGLLEDLSVCRGCLLSDEHAYKLDASHESVMHMTCSLSPLLHAILMLLFFAKKNARAMLQEELLLPMISDIMIGRISKLLDDRNREYQIKVFRKLMDGSLTKREFFPWKKEPKAKFQQYLEKGHITPEDLVYRPRGGCNEINWVSMARLVKDSAFRFQETNGDYIKGNCYGCWGRFNHKKGDPRCRKGMVAEILIHSYFEGALLEMYLLEKRLALRMPTVSHVVDLMVHCSRDRAPLFVDYVAWLLYRYERMR